MSTCPTCGAQTSFWRMKTARVLIAVACFDIAVSVLFFVAGMTVSC